MRIFRRSKFYVKSKIVRRTMEELIEDCGTVEVKDWMEEEFKTKADNIKYIYTIEDENIECYGEGAELIDGTYLVQGDGACRHGVWTDPTVCTYKQMVDILIANCKR